MSNVLNVGGILNNSVVNGHGIRLVIFFTGCSHKCEGCQNKHLQDNSTAIPMDVDSIMTVIEEQIDYLDGITLSGGEPFEQDLEPLAELVERLDKLNLSIWCYTGYKIENLLTKHKDKESMSNLISILKTLDMLVDGPFDINKLDESNIPRGSTNQRLLTKEDILKYL